MSNRGGIDTSLRPKKDFEKESKKYSKKIATMLILPLQVAALCLGYVIMNTEKV